MFFPFNKTAHLVRGHRGTTTAIAGVSIVAVGAALYLSPAGPRDTSAPRQKVRAVTQQVWPSPSPKQRKAAPRPTKRVLTDVVRPPARTNLVVVKLPNHQTVTESIPVTGPALPHCWNFKWQQDAQAAYLANLSDPGGLDSEPGPNNGDGIACNQLPVDPTRPRSMPSGGAVTQAVRVPSKSELLKPAQKYYGVANDQLPGNAVTFDRFDKAVGKAPSLVEWFDTWDHPYDLNGRKVQDAWDRGALPVLTWMPEAKGGNTKDQSAYKLSNIAAGTWDNYLAVWAAQVVQTGLPMVIRFAHEMNGNWYPWSATSHGNTKADYLAAWRHVWNVFEAAGANKYVIWAWTPVRDTQNSGYPRYSSLYPGDSYVDWIGMSGYSYGGTGPTSYDATYGYTFNELKALSTKPIFVAETGAAEAVTTPGASGTNTFASKTDYAAKKASWATQTLASFRADSQLVGFALFDNYVPNVHSVTDPATHTRHLTETDWRWNSSPAAAAAFRAAVASPAYRGGIMPSTAPSGIAPTPGIPWPVVPVAPTATPTATATPTPSASPTGSPTPTSSGPTTSPARPSSGSPSPTTQTTSSTPAGTGSGPPSSATPSPSPTAPAGGS